MKIERRDFDISRAELRSVGNTLKGYAMVWDSLSENLGGFKERFQKNSFTSSLKNDDIRCLGGHNPESVLGRVSAGTLKVWEDNKGLAFDCKLPDTTYAKDLKENIRLGNITGVSVGFRAISDTWDERSENLPIRTVIEAELMELSIVSFPAYNSTSVSIRDRRDQMNTQKEKIIDMYHRAQALKEKAEQSDNSKLTPDENREFIDLMTRYDTLNPEELGFPRFEDKGFEGVYAHMNRSQYDPIKPDPSYESRDKSNNGFEVRAFEKACVYGVNALDSREMRALQADLDVSGGFLVLPTELSKEVIRKKHDKVFIRKLATTKTLDRADSLGAPYLSSGPGDHSLDWSSEIGEAAEDTEMDFERRDLHPHPFKRLVKVSNKLLRLSEAATLVTDELSYVWSIVEEHNFLNGSGVNRPLGVFTASPLGIDTDRDCSTNNTATAIKADNLIECEGLLKEQYRAGARWCFSRAALKMIRKLKGDGGEYLWVQGLQGAPSTILDYPYHISEYCPNTFSASQYVGCLGDWSTYWIADSLTMRVQILRELYARTSQTGFLLESDADGMPALPEAFVRVQLGT